MIILSRKAIMLIVTCFEVKGAVLRLSGLLAGNFINQKKVCLTGQAILLNHKTLACLEKEIIEAPHKTF